MEEPVEEREQREIIARLEENREFVEGIGRKWRMSEALKALEINPSHLAEGWILELIRQFLFYRHAPHLAYGGEYGLQPSTWTEASIILDGVFGVSL